MGFIVTYWYIWLLVMVAGYGYGLYHQHRRMERMKTLPMLAFNDTAKNIFSDGIGKMVVGMVVGISSMVLLVVIIIVE